MNSDFISLGQEPWEVYLQTYKGGSLSAARFLTLMEGQSEAATEEAFAILEARNIALDISSLPAPALEGEAALRLRHEQQLAQTDNMLMDLEETDPLRLYLEELAGIPVSGDIRLLAWELAEGSGDTASLQRKLTELSLGRVVELAKEYTGHGVLLLDLIQEGSLGLWQSLGAYTGGDFEMHRDWWIRQYLAKAVILQAGSSGLGQKLRQAMEDYRAVDERLLGELGREPGLEELAEGLHMTPEETQVVADMLKNARSMEKNRAAETLPQEEDQAVEDTAYFQMRQRVSELLSALSETDAQVLTLRFGLESGLPKTPEETGKILGMTPEEVRQKEIAALAKLRNQ